MVVMIPSEKHAMGSKTGHYLARAKAARQDAPAKSVYPLHPEEEPPMNGRAFVFTGARQPFEAREFPLPEVEPEGILVRVSVANICGSDLHGWHGRTPRSGPTIMGHEMTGRIARLGARVKTDAAGSPLSEGDRIVYSYFYPCRRCDPCRAGDLLHCTARRIGAGRA